MSRPQSDPDLIIIGKNSYGTAGKVLGTLITALFASIGIGILMFVNHYDMWDSIGPGLFGASFALFGLIGFFAVLGGGGKAAYTAVDLSTGLMRLYSGGRNTKPLDISLGRVAYIRAWKEVRNVNSDSSDKYTAYLYSAVLQDGTVLFLENIPDKADMFQEKVRRLVESTGIALRDETLLIGNMETRRSYRADKSAPVTPGPRVVLASTLEGNSYRLRKDRQPLVSWLALPLVLGMFFGLPGFFLYTGIMEGQIATVIFMVIFILIALAMLAFTSLNAVKDYKLTVRSDGLGLEVRFPLIKRLSARAFIPASQVRQVRVNRDEGGSFNLSLVLSSGMELPSGLTIWTGGYRRKNRKAAAPEPKDTELTLWSADYSGQTIGKISAADLVYMENQIQDTLDLKETQFKPQQ